MNKVPLIVTTDWLQEKLEDPNLRLLDATTYLKNTDNGAPELWSGKETYEEGHIPGAVFADLLNDLSDPDGAFRFTIPSRERFVKKMEEIGVGEEGTYVVIYDQGYATVGSPIIASDWASRLAWQLRYEGFDNVAVLEGGFAKWLDEGRPVSAEVKSYPKATFTGKRQPEMIVTKEDVQKAIEDDNVIIINSLSEEDFKNGRIPGSCNVPFGNHADEKTKELHDKATLKENFEKVGALDPDKKVITYCGGGIAATWNALLLNKLGQKNVAVYDGSMAEWTSEKVLPLETD
ncbi:sulfurtransferase [Oceanobacillus halophilus]|uniref:Sulfurtransferase n=1 Tax=Oceanobacillus halophilus TaxID=930130 RepID=A0A494ZR23_9BACI|nr:sulfurtransferase [Oceanobacillus halophilus]RKQ28165.1 sulfurtransferase [Oceanobacillus halophilus]